MTEINTKEILKRVRKIEIKTKHLVEGLLQGAYHSIFKGRGIEFSEVREYYPGDDVRTIDWNVTARMNEPYVKEFIEERDLTVGIMLDVSGSNEFGSEKQKKETAIEMAASLMFAAMNNNDKVCLFLFSNGVEKFIPPRKGRRHTLKMIREMITFQPKQKETNLASSLRFVSKVLKKRSIMFIISDFYCENYSKELNLMKNKHDVVAINMNDSREHQIPELGYVQLEDDETGEQIIVDTSDPEFQKNYLKLIRGHNQELKKMFKKNKIDHINLFSHESFEVPLKKFFSVRERRKARG